MQNNRCNLEDARFRHIMSVLIEKLHVCRAVQSRPKSVFITINYCLAQISRFNHVFQIATLIRKTIRLTQLESTRPVKKKNEKKCLLDMGQFRSISTACGPRF